MASTGQLVLGISGLYHDSAAVLLKDGQIVAAAQEERFTRKKADDSFPVNSIAYVLAEAKTMPEELSAVAFYERPQAKLERLIETYPSFGLSAAKTFIEGLSSWMAHKFDVGSLIRAELGKGAYGIHFMDHHLSHAASAFFPSPFDQAAILTIDGVGEWSTTTISMGDHESISPEIHIEYPDSIGLLYSAITAFCGFKVNSGEYKLMGLAPYGRPRFEDAILSEVITLFDDGSYALNPKYFAYHHGKVAFSNEFQELFGITSRKPESDLTQDHADIAASIQQVTNHAVLGLAKKAKTITGHSRLCLAGGVALNVVSMGELEKSGEFESIWIQPAAGDAGGALGAAYLAYFSALDGKRAIDAGDSMAGAFLGPSPDNFERDSHSALNDESLLFELLEEELLARRIAERLSSGYIVAVARGRMEFGPRALGARSILAPAVDPDMQSKLNLRVKFRESFRPFAPMVLEEDFSNYFDARQPISSPYMLKTFPVIEERRTFKTELLSDFGIERINQVRSDIPAVTHLDYSARVQTIDAVRNPFIHQVLSEYKNLTGISVIVNTSFNVRGEPIVCSASDAVRCFLLTEIDDLVVGNAYVKREDQLRPMPTRQEIEDNLKEFGLD